MARVLEQAEPARNQIQVTAGMKIRREAKMTKGKNGEKHLVEMGKKKLRK